MKYLWIVGALLLASQGGAQSVASNNSCAGDCTAITTTGDVVKIEEKAATTTGNVSAALTEDVTVSIPAIVAMHLHETSWNVNLANLDDRGNDCDCYRAGEHNILTGRDDLYDILGLMRATNSVWHGDGVDRADNRYSYAGDLKWDTQYGSGLAGKLLQVHRYPGIEWRGPNMTQVSWKGPIVCFNRKIVQKFTNASKGWTVNVSLQGRGNKPVTPGFPTFILGDRVAQSGNRDNAANPKKVEVLYDALTGAKPGLTFNHAFARGSASLTTTGGWLDDYILEALVFDGNETAGVKEAAVKFELVGQF
ncbi:hypothetical protein DAETH_31770 [Deinococcus aetherius]|uniref:Uncharacterized protein n=1 Tax=Deinococcus aetherius TaxID=200252 RepID=A0ABN6RMF6_9DEIO|nr:hypothetical protein [Deinococcus aetherius]BDP43208.1 hypothetical protein DAETH_31770 [Deinococcus aetherius]